MSTDAACSSTLFSERMVEQSRLGRWALSKFQPATSASAGRNWARTLVQTSVFWTLFLFVFPWLLREVEHRLGFARLSFPGQVWFPWIILASGGERTRTVQRIHHGNAR